MIDSNDGARFSEAVTLNDGKSQTTPEFFKVGIDSSATGHECPELPSEAGMHLTVLPPAFGHPRQTAESGYRLALLRWNVPTHFEPQGLKVSRHGNQHR